MVLVLLIFLGLLVLLLRGRRRRGLLLVLILVLLVLLLLLLLFLLFAHGQSQIMLTLDIGGVLAERIFIGFDAFGVFSHLIVRVAQVVVGCRFILARFGFFGCLRELFYGFLPPFLLVHRIAQIKAAIQCALLGEGLAIQFFRFGKILLPVAFISFSPFPVPLLGERHQRQ